MEKLPQKDEVFELQKRQAEEQRKKETLDELKSKLQEIIKENPIEIKYCGHGNSTGYKFDKINSISIIDNKYKVKAGIDFTMDKFDRDNYLYVSNNKGIISSLTFEKKDPNYKITNVSFQTLSTMMNTLIRRSEISDLEKDILLQYVVDNFKNKILPVEELEKKD